MMYRISNALVLALAWSVFAFTSGQVMAQTGSEKEQLEPTVILISIDGMRYDYPDRFYAPNLYWLAKEGVRAESIKPIFPSNTFPNHYSLVTGLYAENHGLIDNTIYDPEFDAVFSMGNPAEVTNPRWWGGEPIWVTAEKQGVRSATYFWPGSEADIQGLRPSYWLAYNHSTPNRERVNTVIRWLEKPTEKRPRVITLYFSDVDSMGHRHGPNSQEVAQAFQQIDTEIGYLVDQLADRGWMNQINLMISADHGMAYESQTNHIIIDDILDTDLTVQVNYSRSIVSVFPKENAEDTLYNQLKKALPEHGTVYRKADIPNRLRYKNHRRVAPIVLLAEPGWIFVREHGLESIKASDNYFHPRGGHGYDNKHIEMHGAFIAYGPHFKRQTKIRQITMVDLYNVMAEIVGLEPAPNDGDPEVVELLIAE